MWQATTGSATIYRRSPVVQLPRLNLFRGRSPGGRVVKIEQGRRGGLVERWNMDNAEHHISHSLSAKTHISDSLPAETHISHSASDAAGDALTSHEWPLPLSPLSGEHAKAVELERALRAEAVMASQPAFAASDIIYQDQWLIVINKPSGVYSGHVLSTVSSMFSSQEDHTLSKHEGATESKMHLHLANRLDRDTSGVMIVTKCKIAAGKLTRMFQSRKAKKTYIAFCIGPRPNWSEVYVETGHGRSRWGAWRVYAYEDVGRKLPDNAVVKDMNTRFSVLAVNGERVSGCSCDKNVCERLVAEKNQSYKNMPAFGDEVLLRAHPSTGRTHQIRLHCQFLGLPLRGDVKYGGPLVWKGMNYGIHALHAESMSFRHPITDVSLSFVAPLPDWAVC
ncbi:hypothetical protein GOP47_0008709 [Adiantum capillus-veneris]|uniref:Pseudouridine synthase RsuA/RluA-like domain-containing protein n=1 Tax=Adiantum capillus-veneris TaxID=13818 RepID=A0A9D4ZIF4_ADICA|nr:hypothetical protein GOP47_0008709 [Adiantum capillus-veneris]